MSRNTSAVLKQAVFSQETSQVFIILLTINHASLSQPIRVCHNSVDVTSNGDLYVAYPFEISLPNDVEEQGPRCTLRIDNISRDIIAAIRQIQSPPTVNIEVVLASNPDNIEVSLPDFEMRDIQYDAFIIEGDINIDFFIEEPYPAGNFTPAYFPGIF